MPAPLLPESFVVLDTETTGLYPADGHSIVEIGAQKIIGRDVADEFVVLVNPGHYMDPAAQAIHGITQSMIEAEGLAPIDVFPRFQKFIGDLPLVAHNIAFDMGFLNEHHRRLMLPPLKNQLIDSITLARQSLILPSYSLQNIARYLKIPHNNAHRALGDVETLRQVIFALLDRAKTRA